MPGTFIDQEIDVFLCADAAMVAAIGADVEGANEALANVHVAALVALLPGIRRDLEPDPFGRSRLTFFFEPGHSRHKVTKRTICQGTLWDASPKALSHCPNSAYPDCRDSHATRSAIPTPIEHASRNDPP